MNYKAEATDEALICSLKQLMNIMPFDKITVKMITDNADVQRPTFYKHFKDKYDVIECIFQKDIVESVRPLLECNMFYEGMRLMLLNMKREQSFYIHAARIEGDNSFWKIMIRVLEQVIMEMISDPVDDDTIANPMLTSKNLAEYYSYGISFAVFKWINTGMRINVDDVCEALRFMLSESLTDIVYKRNTKRTI